jgi:hypothetical protein
LVSFPRASNLELCIAYRHGGLKGGRRDMVDRSRIAPGGREEGPGKARRAELAYPGLQHGLLTGPEAHWVMQRAAGRRGR